MKTIFACADPDEFYKIEVPDKLYKSILQAFVIINHCPFDGELWLDIDVQSLKTRRYCSMLVVVTRDRVGIRTDFGYNDLDLLGEEDSLLTLPDIYITNMFGLLQDCAKKHLSEDELELVRSWEQLHAEKLAIY